MPRQIEFYFDFPSPYSYLASTQLPALAARAGTTVIYRPFRILELMKQVGNRPTTIECKNKQLYATADLGRWAARHGVAVNRNPHARGFDYAALLRGALVANDQRRGAAYVESVFRAIWNEGRNLAERPVLLAVLAEAGFDGAALLQAADAPELIARLDQATVEAATRGVFGAPSFFVDDTLYFGNDRLDFVAAALQPAA